MKNLNLDFELPAPWKGKRFKSSRVGYLDFLVGPNGSGKTRFASILENKLPKCYVLSSDRLANLGGRPSSRSVTVFSSVFSDGIDKRQFDQVKGSELAGIAALVLLEQNPRLRVRVEATLSQLFRRDLRLEWDSGRLVPKARVQAGSAEYEVANDECHGIKEILTILTHLYRDDLQSLIIDEPELNLHPQYQAFLMQEIRRVAGDPDQTGKKLIVLITHSPEMLDLQTLNDLRSVISFDNGFGEPHHLFDKPEEDLQPLASLLHRLTADNKRLFFSDRPVFVEGRNDLQLISAIQRWRGVSMEAAGSCLIQAGGCDEITQYVRLCKLFGKKAMFIFDLDALFTRSLRQCVKDDDSVVGFLTDLGIGNDFAKACGDLERQITPHVMRFKEGQTIYPELSCLFRYLQGLSSNGKDNLNKARVAFLKTIPPHRQVVSSVIDEKELKLIEAKLKKVAEALQRAGILLLTQGSLEDYLPSFRGDRYEPSDESKSNAVRDECELLLGWQIKPAELATRYRQLFEYVQELPASSAVDCFALVKDYLSKAIAEIKREFAHGRVRDKGQAEAAAKAAIPGLEQLFAVEEFELDENPRGFQARICVKDFFGAGEKYVNFIQTTNESMLEFELKADR